MKFGDRHLGGKIHGMTDKQVEFLCYEGTDALYGGAAGGGKSVAILAAALQFVDEPEYSALILRRTYKQLEKSDSIMSKAIRWLHGSGARWNGAAHKFTFPSGALLEFGHMQNELAAIDYQGGKWDYVGVDEGTQFSETMISYPKTRQRRDVGSDIPIRFRVSANPGGIGHAHIKARYIKDAKGRDPSGPNRQFFRATIDDNPNMNREEYVAQLRDAGVDPLTLEQLLVGNWDAITGGRFKRDRFRYYEKRDGFISMPGPQWFRWETRPRFMTIDTAASAKTTADYTVIAVWCLSPRGDLVLLDLIRFQKEIPEIILRIKRAVKVYTPQFVGIEEVGAHSGRAIGQILRQSTNPAMTIRSLNPKGKDKLLRATPAITLCHDGRLWFPPEDSPLWPKEDIETELLVFTGDEDAHDDIVDTFGYAAGLLPHLGSSRVAGGPTGSVAPPVPHFSQAAPPGMGKIGNAPAGGEEKPRSLNPAPGLTGFGVGKPPGW